jgi:hypothetical protein
MGWHKRTFERVCAVSQLVSNVLNGGQRSFGAWLDGPSYVEGDLTGVGQDDCL